MSACNGGVCQSKCGKNDLRCCCSEDIEYRGSFTSTLLYTSMCMLRYSYRYCINTTVVLNTTLKYFTRIICCKVDPKSPHRYFRSGRHKNTLAYTQYSTSLLVIYDHLLDNDIAILLHPIGTAIAIAIAIAISVSIGIGMRSRTGWCVCLVSTTHAPQNVNYVLSTDLQIA